MGMPVRSFRDLQVWRKGMEIAREVYRASASLPAAERFGLVAQMRRAAVSLPSNAAEGFRRRSHREFSQFLHVALGSAAELETQIELSVQLHGLDSKLASSLLESLDHFQSLAIRLIKHLRAG